MTSKAMKAALKLLVAKHYESYGASIGKRKCNYGISDDCLDIANESEFIGRICSKCKVHRQKMYYDQRTRQRALDGNPRRKCLGRPHKNEK